MPEQLVGTIQSVIGPVVDVLFASGKLPEIYDAVMVAMDDGSTLVLEVEQQLGNNVVRSVAMGSTDGLRRGMTSVSNGTPIQVPVGPATLGRLFNVTGQPIDGKGDVQSETTYPIHRTAPPFQSRAPRRRCSRPASNVST